MDIERLLDAIKYWIDAKEEADEVRDTLRDNPEASYFWESAQERVQEERAKKDVCTALDSYIDERVKLILGGK